MKLYYTDIFELPLPEKHRFPMSKYRLLRERISIHVQKLSESNELKKETALQLEVPPAATDEQLLLAHHPGYVAAVNSGTLDNKMVKRIGFPWSEKLVERSRRSTGATIAAAKAALNDGCAVNLAGGTHHAFSNAGEGYCVFNDSCVAARILQRDHGMKNILIVDCDVHQGNGSAEIVRDDPSIFSFSIHNQKNYPFRKTESDLDIGLEDDLEDKAYLEKLADGLDQVEKRFQPEFVFYVSGADPFVEDKLGRLNLSKRGLRERDELVFSRFRQRNIPVAVSMAGGYAKDVDDIVDIHFATVMVASQFADRIENESVAATTVSTAE